jgi:hypothetical protein
VFEKVDKRRRIWYVDEQQKNELKPIKVGEAWELQRRTGCIKSHG